MIILWLPRAINDRDAQIEYIAGRNPRAAINQGDRIDSQIAQLISYPEMGRLGRQIGTRELVITNTPFIVVYRIRVSLNRIEVIRLLHSAQNWPA